MTEPNGPEEPRGRGVIGGVIGWVAPAVMRQIDMDAVVDQLDVNAIAEKLDLDALMARLDMDAIVDQLDVNAIAEKLDLDALAARLDMAQLTAGATQDMALSGLDLVRRQLVRADRSVDALVGRLVRRGPERRPAAPRRLARSGPPVQDGAEAAVPPRRQLVSGHYAGPVTRILALGGDLMGAFAVFGFLWTFSLYLLTTFTGVDPTIDSDGWVNRVLLASWTLLWFWVPVALFGRTVAMALAGVAVVRRDGAIANGRRAFVRALVLPVSVAIFALGLIGLVLGKERRTLHDVAAGTVVVYDWGGRQAEQPATIREQLSTRLRRRRTTDTGVGECG